MNHHIIELFAVYQDPTDWLYVHMSKTPQEKQVSQGHLLIHEQIPCFDLTLIRPCVKLEQIV